MKELDGLLEMQQQLDKARSEAESPQEDISGKKEGLGKSLLPLLRNIHLLP